ncbi:unnamed protein product [Urochloa humidicola]
MEEGAAKGHHGLELYQDAAGELSACQLPARTSILHVPRAGEQKVDMLRRSVVGYIQRLHRYLLLLFLLHPDRQRLAAQSAVVEPSGRPGSIPPTSITTTISRVAPVLGQRAELRYSKPNREGGAHSPSVAGRAGGAVPGSRAELRRGRARQRDQQPRLEAEGAALGMRGPDGAAERRLPRGPSSPTSV